MHPEREPDDERWAAFDAALRSVERHGPDSSLRERCLPGSKAEGGRRKDEDSEPDPLHPSSLILPPSKRVLVVDDEPNIRRLIEVHLVRAGYEVLTARDGIEALQTVRAQRPDLIVLDVMMPGPDGFQVLATLKDDPETGEIPVIMLTARGQTDPMRHGLKLGAEFYMSKPFNPEELRLLVDRMAAVLGTPENPPPLRRWPK